MDSIGITHRLRATILALAVILALGPATSVAADADSLDQLIKQLASPVLAQREAATYDLLGSNAIPLRDIEQALQHATLTHEQRRRLTAVAHARFVQNPHGAIGVQFNTRDRSGLVIAKTYEEFPSARVLKEGDVLSAIDGVTLRSITDVRRLVVSHSPGDTVTMTIIRDGEKQDVRVPLGRYMNLSGAQGLSATELEDAWQVRSQSYRDAGLNGVTPIDAGLPRASSTGVRTVSHSDQIICAGGEPRRQGYGLTEPWREMVRQQHEPGVLGLDEQPNGGRAFDATALRLELLQIRAERRQVENLLDSLIVTAKNRANDPNMSADLRRRIDETIEQHRLTIRALDREIRRLENALARGR
jgi:hypothetical protein